MKPLKVLVLTALAATALIAASTASATVLCSEQGTGSPTGSTCPAGKAYGSGTSIHAVASGVTKLTTALKTVECEESTIGGKTENEGKSGEAVKGPVETLSFGKCNCTVTTLKGGTLSVSWISGTHNGTLTSNGAEITASCSTIFGTVHCIYGTSNTDLGTATGGNPSKIDISGAEVPRLTTSGLCSEKGNWDAEYEITTPKPLYVAGAASTATETTLTTSLSGEEKSGEEITVNEGSKVKDTATLSGTNASKATGTVKYKVYADKECKELVTTAGEVTVSEGKVPASEEKTLEAGRVYYWQAEYSGDSNNLKSTSACGKEVLTVKAATSLTTSLSGEGQEGVEVLVKEKVSVTDKGTLIGTNASKAGGTVEYEVYADEECEELVEGAGKVTVSGGSVPSSNEMKFTSGLYFWKATYSGDSTHNGSTSPCGSEVEVVAETTSLTTSLLSESESGEEIEVLEEEPVADTATLSGTNSSKATGSVSYKIYADEECEELVLDAGISSVSEGVVQPSSSVVLPAGTYYWQATYFGDLSNQGSTSACGTEVEHVLPMPLTTTLSDGSQSGTAIEVKEGDPLTDQATLNTANAATATGTVEYRIYADSECEELAEEPPDEVSVIAGSIPASSPVTLPDGVYYWQAVYSGDMTHEPEASVCGEEVLAVAEPTSLTTSLSGEGESGEEIEVLEGAPVTDTATLSGTNAAEATGVVQYDVYADSECEELAAKAGSVEASGEVAPESRPVTLAAGTYYWKAIYYGDDLNQGSVSACGTEVEHVGIAALTIDLASGGKEGSELEVGSEATVTATGTLNTENAGTATGTVKYAIYSDSECTSLVTPAGEVSVSGGVIPASEGKAFSEGIYYWQAVYSGDKTHEAETSNCAQAMQKVNLPWVVSVGDSFISGEAGRWAGNVGLNLKWEKIDALGINAYKNPDNGEEGNEAIPLCHRSISAEIFFKTPGVKSKNLACSGAQTISFSTGTEIKDKKVKDPGSFTSGLDFADIPETGTLNKKGDRCGLSRCKGQATLLQEFAEARKAAKENIKMVVVSIGGNDFEFGPVVEACVKAWLLGGNCSKDPVQIAKFAAEKLKDKRELIEAGINRVGQAMENAEYKKADFTILIQDYPSPIPAEGWSKKPMKGQFRYRDFPVPTRLTAGGCPIKDADAKWANETALKSIDETVKKAYEELAKAAKYTVKFMELEGALNGRRLCEVDLIHVHEGLLKPKFPTWDAPGAVDETEWVNQAHLKETAHFLKQEGVHPNYWAQLALRNCARQAYNNGVPKGGTCTIEANGLFAPPGAPLNDWRMEPRMQLK